MEQLDPQLRQGRILQRNPFFLIFSNIALIYVYHCSFQLLPILTLCCLVLFLFLIDLTIFLLLIPLCPPRRNITAVQNPDLLTFTIQLSGGGLLTVGELNADQLAVLQNAVSSFGIRNCYNQSVSFIVTRNIE